jgi:hypothetical protein
MKNTILAVIVALITVPLFAQDQPLPTDDVVNSLSSNGETSDTTAWFTGGTTALNFSQVYLQNWAAGGQSSVSGTALVQLFANYRRGTMTWDNSLDLAYDLLRQGDQGVVVKTDDRIDFTSKFGQRASDK